MPMGSTQAAPEVSAHSIELGCCSLLGFGSSNLCSSRVVVGLIAWQANRMALH